jgi:hypothetical protein
MLQTTAIVADGRYAAFIPFAVTAITILLLSRL